MAVLVVLLEAPAPALEVVLEPQAVSSPAASSRMGTMTRRHLIAAANGTRS
jgi:hypothetical protein